MIKHLMLILTAGLLSTSAAAEQTKTAFSCGARPSNVPTTVESGLKVDAKAKGNLLLKWIGSAELDSNVDKQKKELYEAHKDYDKFMTDSYFQWVACQIIIDSKDFPDADKVQRWREVYEAIYPQAKVDGSTASVTAAAHGLSISRRVSLAVNRSVPSHIGKPVTQHSARDEPLRYRGHSPA